MKYFRKLKTKDVKTKTVWYNLFQRGVCANKTDEVLEDNKCKICYNFKASSGALKTGYGFNDVVLPFHPELLGTRRVNQTSGVKQDLWLFRFYDETKNANNFKVIYDLDDGNLGYFDVFSPSTFMNKIELDEAFVENGTEGMNYRFSGKDFMLFSSPGTLYSLTGVSATERTANLPAFVSLCEGYDMLFAIVAGKRNEVFYSTNKDPTSWNTDFGIIEITNARGACNQLVFYDDYMYVFMDYGISKISKYSVNGEFDIYGLFETTSRIYAKTVTKCDDFIFFLAEDGIYRTSGSSTKKINLEIDHMFKGMDNRAATACFHDGKFIVACDLNFDDGKLIGCENYLDGPLNNAVIFYDIHTEEISIMRGVDVCSLLAVSDYCVNAVFATFNGEHNTKIGMLDNSGTVFGEPLDAEWSSVNSDLDDIAKIKGVKDLYVKTKHPCVISVCTENECRNFALGGKEVVQRIRTFVKGQEFSLSVLAEGEADVRPIKMVVDVVEK